MISLSKKWWHMNWDHLRNNSRKQKDLQVNSSPSREMYIIYCCVKKKKKRRPKEEKSVILSIKSDTEHCWDTLLKSTVTQCLIIYTTFLFEELPPVFFPPRHSSLLAVFVFFLSLGDTSFNVSSHLRVRMCFNIWYSPWNQSSMCVDLAADLLCLHKTSWPRLECQM